MDPPRSRILPGTPTGTSNWPPVLCLGAPKWLKDGPEDARERPGALKIAKRSKNRTQDDQKGPKIDTEWHQKR